MGKLTKVSPYDRNVKNNETALHNISNAGTIVTLPLVNNTSLLFTNMDVLAHTNDSILITNHSHSSLNPAATHFNPPPLI